MLNITVNKDKIIEYKEENGKKILNGIFVEADIQSLGNGHYHILYGSESHRVEILDFDKNKKLKIKINGKVAEVEVKDRNDLILSELGFTSASVIKNIEVKAPMPGLIIDIKVSEGDTVKTGDPLLVLEAMKMENIIKSPCDGVVKKIAAKQGEIVEKNRLLLQFGD